MLYSNESNHLHQLSYVATSTKMYDQVYWVDPS